MIEFKKVSKILNDKTMLNVCSSSSRSIKVFQWQPYGEFDANNARGVVLETNDFINKAAGFIKMAKEKCADLVLTPEYSFPYEALNEIIMKKDLWPEKGWLWSLGTQGDSKAAFERKLDYWSSISDVIVERYSFMKLSSNVFVSPLIYLFRRNDDKLCILPQFKVSHMKDPWHDFEADGLCIGNVIFVFDLNGEDSRCRNSFLSVICADIFKISANDILRGKNVADRDENVAEDNVIVFHPQLNQNPKHIDFRTFRHCLISQHGKNIKVITLNWAERTKTVVNGKSKKFDMPFSSIYTRAKYKANDEEHRRLRRNNFRKGLFYAYNKESEIDIWYSHRYEHCNLYCINKGFFNGSNPSGCLEEPDAKGCFLYDDKSGNWQIHNLPCRCEYDLYSIVDSQGQDYDFPLELCKSNNNGPCVINECHLDKCDFFFSLCFGENEESELIADNELVDRLVMGSDEESDQKRKHKATQYNQLINQLKANNFPLPFEHFKNNHRMEIFNGYPNVGMEVYNLAQKNTNLENIDLKATVAITKNKHEENEIQELVDNLTARMNEKYRNQVLIYYEPLGGNSITYYDKHLQQPNLTKAVFSKRKASIYSSEF